MSTVAGARGSGMVEGIGKGRILLAEDDAEQRELLGELLNEEGYQVLLAQDSAEVLQALSRHPVDVVLLDWVGVYGPGIESAIRQLAVRPSVVLVSADSRVATRAEEIGAAAYLSKPYDLEELLALVRRVMEARGPEQARGGAYA